MVYVNITTLMFFMSGDLTGLCLCMNGFLEGVYNVIGLMWSIGLRLCHLDR